MKTLFLDNINKKLNIIQIKFKEESHNFLTSDFLKDSNFDSYEEFFKNISFINYYLYEEEDIIKMILKNKKYNLIFNKTNDKKFFIKIFILNYHNEGIFINNQFYFLNEEFINIFCKNNLILNKNFSLITNINFKIDNFVDNFTNKDNFLKKIPYYFYEDKKIVFNNKFNNLYNKNIINEFMIIPPFYIPLETKYKLIDNPVKFLIKSERNCGSNYFEQLISYYFNCNYSEKNCFYKNYISWKHSKLNENDIKIINNRKLITIFIKKDIFSWIQSVFQNPYEINPVNKNFESFIKNKCYDKLSFNIYNDMNNKNDSLGYEDIFDMYYTKYENYLNSDIKSKLYLNYEDILSNHYDIIKLISSKFNLPILREYNQEFNNYYKKQFYLKKEYLKKYNDEIYHYILSKINNKIENFWINNLTKFNYSQYNLIKYHPYNTNKYAIIYYFNNHDVFKLKLSIYLFNKLAIELCDIFIFYNENFDYSNFSDKIRFYKINEEIDLFNPSFINEKFYNYKNIVYLNYDFFLDDELNDFFKKLNNINYDFVFFNTYKTKLKKEIYENINKVCNNKLYNNLDYENVEFMNNNIIIFNKNFFQNNEIINYFEIINKHNINISKNDFLFYFQNLNFKKLTMDIKFYTSELR